MTKVYFFIFFSCCSLFGSFIANPAAAQIYKDNSFISMRLGYIFERTFPLKNSAKLPSEAAYINQNMKINTQGSLIVFSILNYLDLYLSISGSKLFFTNKISSNQKPSWIIGSKLTIFNYRNFLVGIDLKQFYTNQKINLNTLEDDDISISYIPKRFKYKETQLSGGVTYSVAPGVFPYTGVTFINSVINFNNLINLQNFGYFSGISFLMNNKIIISIENIFFNQVSVNIIGEIKF